MLKNKRNSGFTFIELVLVVVIIATLMTLTAGNFVMFRNRVSISSAVSVLINDIKVQQNSAMLGEGEQTIYLDTTSYRLNDFLVNLDEGLLITDVTFPERKIVFATSSGEIIGFTSGLNTITIQNTYSNEANIININRFGVVTSIL